MKLKTLLTGVQFVAGRAIDKYVVQPRRERQWAKKTTTFVHQNSFGQKFELEPGEYVDRHIFQHGVYERRFLDIIAHSFPKNAVALDIGANIGNHAIYLASTFAHIHAFEPNPKVLRRLAKNIELNQLSNVTVHPVGLGKSSATLPFRENNDGNLGASGFMKPGEAIGPLSRKIELRIEHADPYIANLNLDRVDFIKIDVEGWEPPLFEGMAGAIEKYRPIIAFEFHGQDVTQGDYDRIVATLPGYVIAEARYSSADASLSEKVAWNSLHGGRPILELVEEPELRTYENVLAFPDEQSFKKYSI